MNPDKNLKDNLYNYYKQDMMERRIRKDEDFTTEKVNDKVYMDQIKRRNEEDKNKKEIDRAKKLNENMNDYNKFSSTKDEERRNKYIKFKEINTNNSNVNNSQSMGNMNQMDLYSQFSSNSLNNMNPDMTLMNMNNLKKDSLNYIMNPDHIGVIKIKEMEKNKKFEFQKFYKNMLDSQMNYNEVSSPKMQKSYDQGGNMISNPCKN